ncbi:outer membrane beta-barrel protein [Pedobacter cryophilus]|uniref:PorT family protein n=1 Tax=Pedobacter cryophilus TaxID=2571271 RepID=A0A4U1BV42_9SPHI|nr:outer membrane beta-barrel protein [Pedobacter cryophilus]TKB96331.1 PorT family protein [Pedobacter cryophilus]
MKKILLSVMGLAMFSLAQAQEQDTVKKKTTSVIINADGVAINIGKKDSVVKKVVKYPKLDFDLTFEHFDIGLSKYHTGSDFSTPAGYGFLENETWKTSNVGFDLLELSLRFNPNFKIMLAAGLDWNHMRLKQNVTIKPENPVLAADVDTRTYEKNRFSSRYLRVPLYFEYRTAQNDKGKRATIVFGPEVGFLLNGKVKQISDENGKVKVKDDYNFEPFRYGANVRIGYGGAGVFFKYYMNDVFAKNQGPADYKNLNFGLTFGF